MPSLLRILANVAVWGLVAFCILTPSAESSRLTDTKFQIYVTRAEAAAFLLRNRQPPVPVIANEGRYPDALENEWYTRFVVAGIDLGMWEPEAVSNRARPHAILSRGEYLRMLAKALGLKKDGPYAYRDIPPDHPYRPYAGVAAKYKLFFDAEDPYRLRLDLPVTHQEASLAYYAVVDGKPTLTSERIFALRTTVQKQTAQREGGEPERNVLATRVTAISRDTVKNVLQQKVTAGPSMAEKIQSAILHATNAERKKAGLAPLTIDKELQAAAERHAKDMYDRGYFSHFTPDGKNYVDRIKESGYTDVDPVACGCTQVFNVQENQTSRTQVRPNFVVYEADICSCQPKYALGENLAKGQLTVEEVVQDWLNSPSHRRNILEPSFREIGIGVFRDLWVQNFGRFELID